MLDHDAAEDARTEALRYKDSIDDCLREAVKRWNGDLPRTMLDFRAAVLGIFADAIAEIMGEDDNPEILADRWCEEHGTSTGEQFRVLLSDLVNSDRPIYFADIIAYSIGLSVRQGMSGAKLAKKHGVGRQAFSKQCLEFIDKYDLPVSSAMKSELAEQIYSLTNRKNAKTTCKS